MTGAKLLAGFGLITLLFSAFFFWERYSPQRLSFTVAADSVSLPVEIIIPSINLDLPVIPAKLDKGQWEATTKGVSYLASSPIPGAKGNSLLYGHNWPNLLGNILKLKPGQEIKIKFADSFTKTFIVSADLSVSPQDLSVLNPTEDSQITLYTCTGFLDNRRFVIKAKLANQ